MTGRSYQNDTATIPVKCASLFVFAFAACVMWFGGVQPLIEWGRSGMMDGWFQTGCLTLLLTAMYLGAIISAALSLQTAGDIIITTSSKALKGTTREETPMATTETLIGAEAEFVFVVKVTVATDLLPQHWNVRADGTYELTVNGTEFLEAEALTVFDQSSWYNADVYDALRLSAKVITE